jgi:hypothetical protein
MAACPYFPTLDREEVLAEMQKFKLKNKRELNNYHVWDEDPSKSAQ